VTIVLDGPLALTELDAAPDGGIDDLMAGVAALDQAAPAYARAEAYYSGDVPEFFASIRLRRAIMRTGAAFRFNFAAIPVDAVVERLKLAAVTSTDTAADAALTNIWIRNKLALQSRQIIRRACEFGDAYVVVWPSPADDGTVDVFYNSPQCIRVFYDDENPLRKSHAVKRWQAGKRRRADVFYPDRIEKWVTLPNVKGDKPGDWEQYTDNPGDSWPYDNPFGEVPVFHFRNDQPYGIPEHKGFYGPQDAIHKLVLSHMAGVDYQAFPQRYALVHPDSDSSEAAMEDEDVFAFADATTGTTVPPMGEARSQYTADPGSLWFMKGVNGVGQFQTADHANFTEPMLTYLRMGAEVTNTPLHRVDPTGDQPSGQSLRAADAPFVHKIEDRQLSYGDTWRELSTFALRVAGYPNADVTVRWTPAQTVDDLEGWQTVAVKLAAGVPAEQAFLEAGYSDVQVEAWFGPKDDDMPFNVDLLVKIGQALASLGTAQSLGVLSGEQLQALVESVVPVASAESDAS
jgi:hypothetical protein